MTLSADGSMSPGELGLLSPGQPQHGPERELPYRRRADGRGRVRLAPGDDEGLPGAQELRRRDLVAEPLDGDAPGEAVHDQACEVAAVGAQVGPGAARALEHVDHRDDQRGSRPEGVADPLEPRGPTRAAAAARAVGPD